MIHSARTRYRLLHPSLHNDIWYTEVIGCESYFSTHDLIIGASVTCFVSKCLYSHFTFILLFLESFDVMLAIVLVLLHISELRMVSEHSYVITWNFSCTHWDNRKITLPWSWISVVQVKWYPRSGLKLLKVWYWFWVLYLLKEKVKAYCQSSGIFKCLIWDCDDPLTGAHFHKATLPP